MKRTRFFIFIFFFFFFFLWQNLFAQNDPCSNAVKSFSLSFDIINSIKKAHESLEIETLKKNINGKDFLLVLAGEGHIQSQASLTLAKDLLEHFQFRGVESYKPKNSLLSKMTTKLNQFFVFINTRLFHMTGSAIDEVYATELKNLAIDMITVNFELENFPHFTMTLKQEAKILEMKIQYGAGKNQILDMKDILREVKERLKYREEIYNKRNAMILQRTQSSSSSLESSDDLSASAKLSMNESDIEKVNNEIENSFSSLNTEMDSNLLKRKEKKAIIVDLEHGHIETLKERLSSGRPVILLGILASSKFVPYFLNFINLNSLSFVSDIAFSSLTSFVATYLFLEILLGKKFSQEDWFNKIFFFNNALLDSRNLTMSLNIDKALHEYFNRFDKMLVFVGRSHVKGMKDILIEKYGFEELDL